MSFDPVYILSIVIFTAVLLLVEGVYFLLRDWQEGHERAVNRRLGMIAGGADPESTLRKLRRDTASSVSALVARLVPPLDRLIGEAGVTVPTVRILVFQLAAAALIYALLRLFVPMHWWQALALAIALGIILPILVLLKKRAARLKKFAGQLPDTLDLMVRSLKVGHPVATAMTMVAKEMGDPIGTEFGIAVDEMTYGLSLEEALQNMSGRVPLKDLRFVLVAVQIQQSTGGNLAEVLQNLSTVIRSRFAMFAKVKAVSAEGRLGGFIVGALPPIAATGITMMNPNYFGNVVHDPLFEPLLAVAGFLWIAGQITIRGIVKIKI